MRVTILVAVIALSACGVASAASPARAQPEPAAPIAPAGTVCAPAATVRGGDQPAPQPVVSPDCAPAPSAGAAQPCQFSLGFATLRELIPAEVGRCVDDESHNPDNGDALQHTTGGLLVWRKADNWTAFTDGERTWINGPFGLQTRLNSERFAWEGPADVPPASGGAGFLEGTVTIGPLLPVEPAGPPPPSPPPDVCTARGLAILAADGQTPVVSLKLQPDCTYRVPLPPGDYVVTLPAPRGIEFSTDLPARVSVEAGRTARLDFAIDTGIR